MAQGAPRPSPSSSTSPPPVKVLASQLRRCCRRDPVDGWLLDRAEFGRRALAVPVVWMQGKVLSVEAGPGGGAVRLRDGSGCFVAEGAGGVPKGRPCLHAGKYVMVLGLVRSCGPGEPTLRALKLTDLSGNPLNEASWEAEVEELHRRVLP
ncbi:recQ-mediated genome instability protein 2 [Anolis carolinensis]|uniref:RecQ mediated genome instability 2 n=1 Tax=Anolis carolinensis TaxID=28377 RepID=G1KRX2_ANOCA|nr:PREDICTED: recQ-mediated genome instability protein 2 [Anolis carolinensis]|eukprot:XP_008102369.1 PREDICTED: recQ-mediated genome instability protein 2 [Anolis carolinensis]